MDIDMEIDYDASANYDAGAQQLEATQNFATVDNTEDIPAAYFEDLGARPLELWPDFLNLQGVSEFDPNDPLYYAMEHCLEPRVKQTRWINDNSVNLQYYSAADAAMALQALTDPGAGDPASIPAETGRRARPYSKRPAVVLTIRQANAGDQKARGAANRSNYYKHNPDLRGDRGDYGRDGPPRRREPPRQDVLDYGDDGNSRSRTGSTGGDERMREGSDYDNRRFRVSDNRNRNGQRERNGRLKADTDSYRPGSRSPRESRFGRLRGRSASPASADDGDGRYGFTEQGTNTRSRYRSRSRSRNNNNNNRRRREPSGERWEHDRAGFGEQGTPARWQKETYAFDTSPMSNHRRSGAFDETANQRKGSLLERMTKDGKPLAASKRSLASRMTRDDGDSYGRLKDDHDFHAAEFDEPAPRNLASRITRDDGGIQIRGRGGDTEGINIRGASSAGFSIRGMAGGH
ncbi:hypothetical protein CC80DRAFT_288531 [Byssothecium circinans]|uniref:Uncharacterized protein n=1 Tax=Byssothecium circinans TaxID=147558 RepID=A0A6A5U8P8_9PLEO|nr:hypothetical protein CC80DRAFT_288531 [Byssothecium circinans]